MLFVCPPRTAVPVPLMCCVLRFVILFACKVGQLLAPLLSAIPPSVPEIEYSVYFTHRCIGLRPALLSLLPSTGPLSPLCLLITLTEYEARVQGLCAS